MRDILFFICFLTFILFVVGIFTPKLLTKIFRREFKRRHASIGALIMFIACCIVVPPSDNKQLASAPKTESKPAVATADASKADDDKKQKAEADAKAKADAEAVAKQQESSPDYIKSIVVKQLGEKANTDKKPPKVADIQVNDDLGEGVPEGEKIVILTLNGNDSSLTTKPNEALWMDTLAILKPLFQDQKIYELDIDWQLPLVDTYGNTKDGRVMGLKFTRKQVDQINWDQFLYTNIPVISKDAGFYWEHPALSK